MHSTWRNDGCIASRVLVLLHLYSRHILSIRFSCVVTNGGAHVVTALSVCKIITNGGAYAAEFYVNPKSRMARLKPPRRCFIFAERQLNILINVIWFSIPGATSSHHRFLARLLTPVSPSSPFTPASPPDGGHPLSGHRTTRWSSKLFP